MSAHRKCPVNGCRCAVARNKLMCPTHWWMVPGPMQNRVYALYRTAPGSQAHFKVMLEVVDHVNECCKPKEAA